jgi:glycosyltransferase involved in cell wall biosynthesis
MQEALSPTGQRGDSSLRVAIAHDWMVSYAGSERCVEEMLKTFSVTKFLTTVLDRRALPPALREASPSLLQRLPGARKHHEWLLPLMPLAWALRPPIEDVDVVISSSHACAKAVRVRPGVPHLCYCYAPMRYAWSFDAERNRFPAALRPAARAGMAWLRRWDRKTARRVHRFVAISQAVADRIERFYGRPADVVHPPVKTDYFTPGHGEPDDYFLYVGRLVSYKRPELVVEAFRDFRHRLKVVGDGHMRGQLEARAAPNTHFLGAVEDAELRELYRRARALVFPAEEDFGIVMAEAQAYGTPVVALARGGALDIVQPGLDGWLIKTQTVSELRRAVQRAASEDLDRATIRRRAERFSAERFRREIYARVAELVESSRAGTLAGASASP